jgi:O-antigen/teichoic acid export membrane protein
VSMVSTASDGRGGDPLRQIARGSMVTGVGALVVAVGGVLFTLAVARSYRPELAGTFFASTAFFLIVSSVAQLGTDVGLVRYVSAHAATGQRHRLGETLRIALIPVIALSSLCAVGMWFVAPALADWIGRAGVIDDTITVLRALTPFVPVTATYGALLAATRGRGSMKYTVMIDSLVRTAAQPVLFLLTVAVGLGPGWGAVAWASPYALGVVVASVVLWREARQAKRLHQDEQLSIAEQTAQMTSPIGISGLDDGVETLPSGEQPAVEPLEVPGRALWRDFWSFTAARAVAGTVVMIWKRFDVLLVAALSGPADAAIYTAATRFLVVGNLGIQAVQMTVSPQLGKLFAQRDLPGARRVYRTATMWTMTFTWPLYITTAAAVGLIIPVFGAEYDAGSTSVVVLSTAMLVATSCGSVDSVLLMSGRSLLSLGNATLTLAANVALDLILIPKLGILGAALGWAMSIALRNLLALVQINVLMKMWPFTRWSGLIAVAALGCFALVPGILTVTDAPSLWIVAALVAGAIGYTGFAYMFRRELQLDTFVNSARRRRRRMGSRPTTGEAHAEGGR